MLPTLGTPDIKSWHNQAGHPGRDKDDGLPAEYVLRQLPVGQLAELEMPPSKKCAARAH
jgi:hypothetical protein